MAQEMTQLFDYFDQFVPAWNMPLCYFALFAEVMGLCVCFSAPGKDAAVLPWEVRHKVAVGVARALEYLHKGCTRPVVHRDVKTSNILLTANFESQVFCYLVLSSDS